MSDLGVTVEQQLGQIVAVYELQSGGTLTVAVIAGATTLTVDDATDFHEGGGQLYLASADTGDTSEVIAYTAADLTTGVITLAAPWPADWVAYVVGDFVWCAPLVTERRADVALDGETDQLVTARVPYTLAAQVPVGVRPGYGGEWLRVGLTDLGYVVVDLEGEYPRTDPASVVITDPDTGEEIGVIGGDAAFDTITADEVYSPSVPWRNPDDLLLYVDPVTGNDDNDGTAYPPLVDTFSRVTGPNSLGTADSGQAWVQAFNSGNLNECNGTDARMRTNGGGQFVFNRNPGFAALDSEMFAVLNYNTWPSGIQHSELVARMVDNNNFYSFSVMLNSGGGGRIDAAISKRVSGTYTQLAITATPIAIPNAGNIASFEWGIRAQVQTNPDGGTDLRLKVWDYSQPEPGDWMVTANDSQSVLQVPSAAGMHIRSGASQTTVIITFWRQMSAAVIDAGGLVIDTDVSGVGPLMTIAEALARVGDFNDGTVRIVAAALAYDEQVNVVGIAGGGNLIIDGANTGVIYGTLNVVRCSSRVEVRNITLQDTGDVAQPNKNSGTLEVGACAFVYGVGVQIQSNTSRASCIFCYDGTRAKFDSCQLSGPTTNAANVVDASEVAFNSCTGAGPTNAYRCAQAIVFTYGSSQPTGGNLATNSGKIFTQPTAESNPPSGGGGSPPPTSSKKTTTYNADSTCTWRPEWGWRTDNDEAYQGEYAGSGGLSRGVAFFGSKWVRSRTADSGKVTIKRAGYGGASQAQAVFLCTFAEGSKPSGKPTIVNGPSNVGSLAWGQSKTFDLPKAWCQALLDGNAKAVGIYHGSASPYIICEGRKNGESRFQVKITHH